MIDNRTLFIADNLDILREMESESVDLIYLDPPFDSNRVYKGKEDTIAENTEFSDVWRENEIGGNEVDIIYKFSPHLSQFIDLSEHTHNRARMNYLSFLAVRLIEMKRILKDTGSIYLHCDPTASHHLKLMLDILFKKNNFRNEIVWHYTRWSACTYKFQSSHDIILYYSRSANRSFNTQYVERRHNAPWTLGSSPEGENSRLLIYDRERTPQSVIDKATSQGRKVIDVKKPGTAAHDVWSFLRTADMDRLNSMSNERCGYPTQKPLTLLERIIKASSNEGDIVLDPFAGCGTTLVAAEMLQRRWIGIEQSKQAKSVILKRLKDVMIEPKLFSNIEMTDIIVRNDL